MKKLLLLDGNSMLFRAYYATLYTRRMSTSNGIPTNAVYGFIMMLLKAIDTIEPDGMLVAWDAGKNTFRHKQYDQYKGTRKPLDEELAVQFPIVREFLDAAKILRYECDEYEADDIIGSMAKLHPEIETTILTSDRDLLQLVDASTSVLLMKKGISEMELLNEENFEEKQSLKPLQIIDLKGLMGDSSDNIPGVSGVGEKTAKKLLDQFQTVENVYAHIDDIKGKLKEKLIQDKDKAFLSKELATIYTKINFPFELEQCTYTGMDEEVNNFYQKYEMRSLIKESNSKKKTLETNFKIMNSLDFESKEPWLFPVCSYGNFLNQKLYGFLVMDKNQMIYMDAEKALEDTGFSTFLNRTDIKTWDSKETNHILDRYGFNTVSFSEDIHLASFLLHSQSTDADSLMDALSIELPESFHSLSKKTKEYEPYAFDRVLPFMQSFAQQVVQKEASIIHQLKDEGMYLLYKDIEQPLSSILFEMENEGIRINEETLNAIGDSTYQKIQDLSNQIYAYANTIFNINSPKQLAAILFDELGLKAGKKRSTSAEVLEKLQGQHPIIDVLLEYRKYSKIMSTYIEGLKKHIQKDGKIHTTFNQTMTQTGRLSSSDPNLQNISIRDEEGREIRKAFVAKKGHFLLSADYSQIELRMLAHMANEEHMIEAFKNDEDIHSKTASLIYDCDIDAVNSSMRRVAKTVNFGIVYGQSAFGLSSQLGISRNEAMEFMAAYFANYPNIHAFMEKLIEGCKDTGYVETLFHRRRMIPEINDKNYMTREFGKRAAMNAPIQGSAADLIKVAMLNVSKAMEENKVKSKLLLQIHDELIFEVPEDEIELMVDLVRTAMEGAMDLKVPLRASISFGKTWYEAK